MIIPVILVLIENLGRGYFHITAVLTAIGISSTVADTIGNVCGATTSASVITANNLQDFTITLKQQYQLFTTALAEHATKINDSRSFVDQGVDFDTIHPAIKGIVLDLRITDHHTGAVALLASAIIANDPSAVMDIMID